MTPINAPQTSEKGPDNLADHAPPVAEKSTIGNGVPKPVFRRILSGIHVPSQFGLEERGGAKCSNGSRSAAKPKSPFGRGGDHHHRGRYEVPHHDIAAFSLLDQPAEQRWA